MKIKWWNSSLKQKLLYFSDAGGTGPQVHCPPGGSATITSMVKWLRRSICSGKQKSAISVFGACIWIRSDTRRTNNGQHTHALNRQHWSVTLAGPVSPGSHMYTKKNMIASPGMNGLSYSSEVTWPQERRMNLIHLMKWPWWSRKLATLQQLSCCYIYLGSRGYFGVNVALVSVTITCKIV